VNTKGRSVRLLLVLVAGLLVVPTLLVAQQGASVTGVVTDQTGASVAGVKVTLANKEKGFEKTTMTNEIGVYSYASLVPGTGYSITFSKDGFKTVTIFDVYLAVGTASTHNAQIEVGAVSETIEVQAESAATLNTTNATIGNAIETRRIQDLPILIRTSPARLLGLQAGVVANTGGGANRDGAVTGARTDQGNITVDGIDVNDMAGGFAFTTVGQAPIDTIQEFRTVTANPLADAGRSSGAQIQLITKSGSNEWHGSLRVFLRNDKFASNSFFNNKAGTPKPKLHRNQYGASFGGYVIKDKLFFFSDYEGRRDTREFTNARTAPLAHVFQGSVAYVNTSAGCSATSTLATAPSCVTILTPAQVRAIDPRGIGASPELLTFLSSRYPVGQLGLGLGNGVNTGGVRFNSPVNLADNIYTNKIDFNTVKHRLFGVFTIQRFKQDRTDGPVQQFPGDERTTNSTSRDWRFSIGHTWSLSTSMINQATFGITKQVFAFNRTFRPSFPNSFTFGGLSAPFTGLSSQGRDVPVPTIRDDFTYVHGKHTWQAGFTVKPIQQKSQLTNDFNFITVGLGGFTSALCGRTSGTVGQCAGGTATTGPNLRPNQAIFGIPNIFNNATSRGQWDSTFTFLLGRFASASAQANYNTAGTPFPAGTGKNRNFKYNEYETYFGDTWRMRNDFTLGYGVRWQYYSVPYEANGFQAINDIDLTNLLGIRTLNGANGVSGDSAEPFLRYDLGGKANNTRGYSEPDLNNFAPRFSVAYNPSFRDGFLGRIFGDRKTVVRAGGSIVYDRVAGAITFIQDQVSYLFDNNATRLFGNANPVTALQTDPRFTGITTLPVGLVPSLPSITRPFTPFVSGGVPTGNGTGEFNFAVDQNFRTPYAYTYALSVQREIPGNMIAEVVYVGRMGRKLFAQADAAQVIDFRDNASSQFMIAAFNALQQQIIAGSPITTQPWFENQMNGAVASNFSSAFGVDNCPEYAAFFFGFSVANCTQLVDAFFGSLVEIGDTSDTVQAMFGNGLLLANVGLSGQFSTNIYNGSFASSSYNGLLVTLRKRYSQNLQFDLNYTYSHSIDNQSSVVNTVAGGLICDLRNLRVCRGNSDFDAAHIINANWIYDLPIGRGQFIGRDIPTWLNHVIGGWEVSGIYSWRTGFAFSTTTGSFPVGFNFNSPAAVMGARSALEGSIHTVGTGSSSTLQFFRDPTAALGALRNPNNGEIGSRNNLRGPRFSNVDVGVLKNFKMPWSEKHRLQFRWEMYNAFNHPSFLEPNANFNSGSFGQISGERSSPREMQFALRYDF